jgi:hypothetical protein
MPKPNELPNPYRADKERQKAVSALQDYLTQLHGIVSHVEIVLETLTWDEPEEERHA